MSIPAIIVLVLSGIGLIGGVASAASKGSGGDAVAQIIATGLLLGLLTWGGFFSAGCH